MKKALLILFATASLCHGMTAQNSAKIDVALQEIMTQLETSQIRLLTQIVLQKM